MPRIFLVDEKINLTIFYNSMSIRLAMQGEKIYQQKCSSCHGENGTGNVSFVRIAGQQPLHIVKTLKQFRDNANAKTEKESTKRSSNIMESIIKQYSDKEIEIIAAYVAQLQ